MPADKDEIARAFMALAFRFGYRRTTVEDVARTLRISKKTIYEHFRGKDGLLEYALELTAAEQRRSVEARLSAPSVLGRVLEVVSIALADVRGFCSAGPHAEMVEPPELAAEVNARVFAPLVRGLVDRGVARGEFTLADPGATAAFCMAIGMEAVRMIREDPQNRPDEAMREALERLLTG